MSLEEKIRAYAAKGELVHLSLAFSAGTFKATFAAASPLGGYSIGSDADPVEAIEKAFKASPAKPARVGRQHVSSRKHDPVDEPKMTNGSELERAFKDGSLPTDWTAP